MKSKTSGTTALMKKAIGLFLVVLTVINLSACGSSLNGTYIANDDSGRKYTFNGNVLHFDNIDSESSIKATYEIKNKQITFSMVLFGEKTEVGTYSFEMDGSSIFIDGVEFVKE